MQRILTHLLEVGRPLALAVVVPVEALVAEEVVVFVAGDFPN
jgi:hypothetical protein